MAEREAKKPQLEGRLEIDDADLGAAGKTPLVAAVETIDRRAIDPSAQQRASLDARGAERRPRRLTLTPTGQPALAGS
jgi:hypothetical protein